MEVTLLLVIGIFGVNVFLHRPVLESFLFSMALAVGMTPQLLPAIVSINLAHGARRMAGKISKLDNESREARAYPSRSVCPNCQFAKKAFRNCFGRTRQSISKRPKCL